MLRSQTHRPATRPTSGRSRGSAALLRLGRRDASIPGPAWAAASSSSISTGCRPSPRSSARSATSSARAGRPARSAQAVIAIAYLDGRRLSRAVIAGAHFVGERAEPLNKINVFPVPDGDTGTNLAVDAPEDRRGHRPDPRSGTSGEMSTALADEALGGRARQLRARSSPSSSAASPRACPIARASRRATSATAVVRAGRVRLRRDRAARRGHDPDGHPRLGARTSPTARGRPGLRRPPARVAEGGEALAREHAEADEGSRRRRASWTPARRASSTCSRGSSGTCARPRARRRCPSRRRRRSGRRSSTGRPSRSSSATAPRRCSKATRSTGTRCGGRRRCSGDSIVIAGGASRVRLHVHTNEPEKLFEIVARFAEVAQTKVEDMRAQHETRFDQNRAERVGIVTDSTCDLPAAMLEELNVGVVPVRVYFGSENYLDKVTLTPAEFYARFAVTDEAPEDVAAAARRLHAGLPDTSRRTPARSSRSTSPRRSPGRTRRRSSARGRSRTRGSSTSTAATSRSAWASSSAPPPRRPPPASRSRRSSRIARDAADRVRSSSPCRRSSTWCGAAACPPLKGFIAKLLGLLPGADALEEGDGRAGGARRAGSTPALQEDDGAPLPGGRAGKGRRSRARFGVAHCDAAELAERLAREIRERYSGVRRHDRRVRPGARRARRARARSRSPCCPEPDLDGRSLEPSVERFLAILKAHGIERDPRRAAVPGVAQVAALRRREPRGESSGRRNRLRRHAGARRPAQAAIPTLRTRPGAPRRSGATRTSWTRRSSRRRSSGRWRSRRERPTASDVRRGAAVALPPVASRGRAPRPRLGGL